jgi:putative salt-induced outer membrane protein YdiY
MRTRTLWVILICCSRPLLAAEQVTLTNGDRISGSIVNLSAKKLTIKTEYAGPIILDWTSVAEFATEQPMFVTKTDGQVLSGTLGSKDSVVVVKTQTGAQQVPMTDVAVIRSQAEQTVYEKSQHPGILQGWTGGGSLGLALARGNSDTTNLALGFNAARPTPNDKLTIEATSIYSTSATGGVTSTTANALGGSVRYDHNITKKLFLFGLFVGAYDHAQALNERLSPGGGLGYHAISTKATTLDLLGGFGYTYENYSTGLINNLFNATIGDEFTHKINDNTAILQDFYFFPYLNDNGGYRGVFDFGLASKLYRILTWNLNFSDRYNSKPVLGKKNNDVLLTTGLGFTFGAKAK